MSRMEAGTVLPISVSPQTLDTILSTCWDIRTGRIQSQETSSLSSPDRHTQQLQTWLRACLLVRHIPLADNLMALSTLVFHTFIMHKWPRESSRVGRRSTCSTTDTISHHTQDMQASTPFVHWTYDRCSHVGDPVADEKSWTTSIQDCVQLLCRINTHLRTAPNFNDPMQTDRCCSCATLLPAPFGRLLCWWSNTLHRLIRSLAYLTVAAVPPEHLQNPWDQWRKRQVARARRRAMRQEQKVQRLARNAPADILSTILQEDDAPQPPASTPSYRQPKINDLFAQQLQKRHPYESLEASVPHRTFPNQEGSGISQATCAYTPDNTLFGNSAHLSTSPFVLSRQEHQKENERISRRVLAIGTDDNGVAALSQSDSDTSLEGEGLDASGRSASGEGHGMQYPDQAEHKASSRLKSTRIRFWMEQARLHHQADTADVSTPPSDESSPRSGTSTSETMTSENQSEPGRGTCGAKGNKTGNIGAIQLGVLHTASLVWHAVDMELQLMHGRQHGTAPRELTNLYAPVIRQLIHRRMQVSLPKGTTEAIKDMVYEGLLVGNAYARYCDTIKFHHTKARMSDVLETSISQEYLAYVRSTVRDKSAPQLATEATHPFRDLLDVCIFAWLVRNLSGYLFHGKYYKPTYRRERLCARYMPMFIDPAPVGTEPSLVPMHSKYDPLVPVVLHILGRWAVLLGPVVVWCNSGLEAISVWCCLFLHAPEAQTQSTEYTAISRTLQTLVELTLPEVVSLWVNQLSQITRGC